MFHPLVRLARPTLARRTSSHAGAYAGESFRTPRGVYLMVLVDAGEFGYVPSGHYHTLDEAQAFAARWNAEHGVTPERVREILCGEIPAEVPR